jgi:hypothetical protein
MVPIEKVFSPKRKPSNPPVIEVVVGEITIFVSKKGLTTLFEISTIADSLSFAFDLL